MHNVLFQQPVLHLFFVSCGIREQWSITAWSVVLLVLEGFSLTGGHHFVHLSVHRQPLGTSRHGRLCQGCGKTGAMGGPSARWVSGQANRFYLRFTHHAKPLLAWYSHVHCSEDYGPSISRLSFFLFHFLFFSPSLVFLMFPICLSSTTFCLLSTIISISLPLVPA